MFFLTSKSFDNDHEKYFELMQNGLKSSQHPMFQDEFDHDDAEYVLYKHKKFGIAGGVRLIQAGKGAITDDYLRRLKYDPKNKIYEISRVFFQLPEGMENSHPDIFELIKRDFYIGLYDALKTVSVAQKIKTFISVLTHDEFDTIRDYGLWPFARLARLNIEHIQESDGVLGVLPMSRSHYTLFQNRRTAYESKLNKLVS